MMEGSKRETCNAICRCCLENGIFDKEDNLLISIAVDTKKSYLDMFSSCFSLNIILPKLSTLENFICDVCIIKLINACAFKKQVQRAQNEWKARLEHSKTPDGDIKENDSIEDSDLESRWTVEYLDEDRDVVKDGMKTIKTLNDSQSFARNLPSELTEKYTTNWDIIAAECGVKHVSDGEWRRRLNKKISVRMKQCLICKTVFSNVTELRWHLNKHFPVYTCKKCGKSLATKKRAYRHNSLHDNSSNYKCRYCDQQFTNQFEFQSHLHEHPEYLRYQCPRCPERFNTHYAKYAHINREHLDAAYRSHECSYCIATFTSTSQCKEHTRRVHLKERNHFCACGTGFYRLFELKRHQARCTPGRRAFECDVCDETFATVRALWAHVKIHAKI